MKKLFMVVGFIQMRLIEKQWIVHFMIKYITTMIECVVEQCHCNFYNDNILRIYSNEIYKSFLKDETRHTLLYFCVS